MENNVYPVKIQIYKKNVILFGNYVKVSTSKEPNNPQVMVYILTDLHYNVASTITRRSRIIREKLESLVAEAGKFWIVMVTN